MYKLLTLMLCATLTLAACSKPNKIIVAVPQTGDLYPVGNYLYNQVEQRISSNSELKIFKANSGCSEDSAEEFAEEILAIASDIKLVVGPLCYGAWNAVQKLFSEAGIAQLPLIPTRSWEELIEDESKLLARFSTEKMQSTNTMIAYTASQYGNTMAERLIGMAGENAHLFPLANLTQTSEKEADKIILADPSVLILVGEYPKAVNLLEALFMRGLNSVLLLTNPTQPSLIIERFGAKRLARTRFTAATDKIEQANNLQTIQAEITLAQINQLAEEKITPALIESLEPPPKLKLVRVARSGELAFELGME